MRTALVIAACVVLTGAVTTNAREAVGLRVSPNISMAPATVRVLVTVEPDANNKELVLEADSGSFYTSSVVQLDGDKSSRSQTFLFKELPAGTYEVTARVVQRNGDVHKASGEYMVLE